jgi:quinol-cytochrome oxidoreductase complex cytochrome b subunit
VSGGIYSVVLRLELYGPGNRVISPENQYLYNLVFTAHGILMIFYLVMPVLYGGFGNYTVPVYQGAGEVGLPRANGLSLQPPVTTHRSLGDLLLYRPARGTLSSIRYILVCAHLVRYPCPIGIGSPWNTGTVLGTLVYTQLCTGILLGLHYTPGIYTAYYSIIHTYREVYHGAVYRLLHSGGASLVFLLVLAHVYRGALRGSYMYVSSALSGGTLVYGVLMAIAFLGYILPWGAMSYWGATVITNLYTGVPCMVPWFLGGFYLTGPSLPRYSIIHSVLPAPALAPLVLHGLYIHRVSTTGGPGYNTNNRVHFHAWLVRKDTPVLVQGILVVLVQVYRGPLVLAHPDNSPPASVVLTPLHIVPEWYYLGYYGVLKAVPGRAPGFLVMVSYTLGAGTYGEPYSTGPLEGGHLPAPRYQGVFLLSLVVLYSLWAGAQLPQGRYVSYGRGYILVSLGCNIGYIPCPRPPTSSLTPYRTPT